MSDRIFVDTNVLVYAYDRSEPEKQRRALEMLDRLAVTGAGMISTQILSEFFVAVTQKIAAPLSVDEACDRLKNYVQSWTVVDLTGMIVEVLLRMPAMVPFYDSLRELVAFSANLYPQEPMKFKCFGTFIGLGRPNVLESFHQRHNSVIQLIPVFPGDVGIDVKKGQLYTPF